MIVFIISISRFILKDIVLDTDIYEIFLKKWISHEIIHKFTLEERMEIDEDLDE